MVTHWFDRNSHGVEIAASYKQGIDEAKRMVPPDLPAVLPFSGLGHRKYVFIMQIGTPDAWVVRSLVPRRGRDLYYIVYQVPKEYQSLGNFTL